MKKSLSLEFSVEASVTKHAGGEDSWVGEARMRLLPGQDKLRLSM